MSRITKLCSIALCVEKYEFSSVIDLIINQILFIIRNKIRFRTKKSNEFHRTVRFVKYINRFVSSNEKEKILCAFVVLFSFY